MSIKNGKRTTKSKPQPKPKGPPERRLEPIVANARDLKAADKMRWQAKQGRATRIFVDGYYRRKHNIKLPDRYCRVYKWADIDTMLRSMERMGVGKTDKESAKLLVEQLEEEPFGVDLIAILRSRGYKVTRR